MLGPTTKMGMYGTINPGMAHFITFMIISLGPPSSETEISCYEV